MTRDTEARITAVAACQQGVVTRSQLIAAGLSPWKVDRRLRAGRLRRMHRGVYLVGLVAPPLAREMAAVLAGGPGALVSHLSAGRLWGLWPPHPAVSRSPGKARPAQRAVGKPASARFEGSGLVAPEPVEITVVDANRARCPGIRVHCVERLEVDERSVVEGIPVTAVGRTLLDLAAVWDARELETAVALAEREGLVTHDTISTLLTRHRGRRGVRSLRAVLDVSGGPALTRSEAELRFLDLVRESGLPTPEVNVAMGRYEIDFLWRAMGIAVEVDGYRHHSSRPRFEGDRRKDAWLLAGGIKVLRLSWRQIANEALATAVQVGQALALAGGNRPQSIIEESGRPRTRAEADRSSWAAQSHAFRQR